MIRDLVGFYLIFPLGCRCDISFLDLQWQVKLNKDP